jgi:hypothetical protein
MRIGYVRVSTGDQSLDLPLDALKKAGGKRIFTDKVSTTKAYHPGLTAAVSHLRNRDVLVIGRLDRLGCSVKPLVDFVADLPERDLQFRSLADGIDTTTPSGRFFFHQLGTLLETRASPISMGSIRPVVGWCLQAVPTQFQASINSIHFYPNMIAIEKNQGLLDQFVALRHGTEWHRHQMV